LNYCVYLLLSSQGIHEPGKIQGGDFYDYVTAVVLFMNSFPMLLIIKGGSRLMDILYGFPFPKVSLPFRVVKMVGLYAIYKTFSIDGP
jgi:hypothetical protein